jgi:hypothetical protein
MSTSIPTVPEVREWLYSLSLAGLQAVADNSNVPFTTLVKIRLGLTKNPHFDTMLPLLEMLPRKRAVPKNNLLEAA